MTSSWPRHTRCMLYMLLCPWGIVIYNATLKFCRNPYKGTALYGSDLHSRLAPIETGTKWLKFWKRHFLMFCVLFKILLIFFSEKSDWQWVTICSGNWLAANMNNRVQQRIYTSLAIDQLSCSVRNMSWKMSIPCLTAINHIRAPYVCLSCGWILNTRALSMSKNNTKHKYVFTFVVALVMRKAFSCQISSWVTRIIYNWAVDGVGHCSPQPEMYHMTIILYSCPTLSIKHGLHGR